MAKKARPKHADVDDHAAEVKRERDAGNICIAANLLLTPAECAHPDVADILQAKARNVLDSLIASAQVQLEARRVV